MAASDVTWVRVDQIKTHSDMALFPIDAEVVDAIAASMRATGFDPAQPLVLWQEQGYVVDGHTRLVAAKEAGQSQAPVVERSFDGWDDALAYAIARQRDRRNLSRQQINSFIAHVVRATDKLKPQGQRNDLASGEARLGKSAEQLGEQLGVSHATVERTRAVLASDDETVKGKLLAGEIAPKAAYEQVKRTQAARADSADAPPTPEPTPAPPSPQPVLFTPAPQPARKSLPTSYSIASWLVLSASDRVDAITHSRAHPEGALNKQETDNIEWARWSWNPITGCLHNCPYCYARDIANRFYAQGFAPTFLPNRLSLPAHQRVPAQAESELGWRNIFTCSMADLFGKWVPSEWIEAVLAVVRENPQWNFLFLTKFPNRLAEFEYPQNAWLGTSVDCQARVKNAERSFERVRGGVKWLSVEPMLEPLHFDSLSMFDWMVIGGASKSSETPEWIPPLRWVRDLEADARAANCMIYEKANLGARLREYPGWERPEPVLPDALRYLPSIGE